jgi:hypothetical protein
MQEASKGHSYLGSGDPAGGFAEEKLAGTRYAKYFVAGDDRKELA